MNIRYFRENHKFIHDTGYRYFEVINGRYRIYLSWEDNTWVEPELNIWHEDDEAQWVTEVTEGEMFLEML